MPEPTKLSAAVAFLALAGCATLTEGTSQVLTFNLEPQEAVCVLTRVDDGELGTVNGDANTVRIGKDKDDIVIRCSAPGYRPKTVRLESHATAAGETGVLIDFGLTDMMTGAMYAYPPEVTVTLERDAGAAAGAQAR